LGIRVNAVCPGLTNTQIWRDILNEHPNAAGLTRHWLSNIPLRRVQEPREVGNVVVFLASDESSYITGAEVFTDGGLTAMLTNDEAVAE
jgi:NAD(P)-dependent dehydrogenase (short-subunit alcohol dehydrogenase family)